MKRLLIALAFTGFLAGNAFAEDKPAADKDKSAFKDEREKVSYALGLNIGTNWKRNDIDVDPDVVFKAVKDVMSGKEPAMTEQEAQAALMGYQQELMAKQEKKRKEQGEVNKKAGDDFLAANKSKDGVKTLPSGLQYKVEKSGSGDSPKADDTVVVNYKGTLIDGTEFDSSYKRGQPATFRVGGVIKGWQEALQLMSPGSKWQLFVPADLAYGEYGHPPSIPPNATLIFEVELVSIQPPAADTRTPITSDIIKVPSAEEMKKGAKIERIKPEDLDKEIEKEKAKEKSGTNQPPK
jgi:FKBP-type peptidyl-prolyl cis-trans isomerase FklB